MDFIFQGQTYQGFGKVDHLRLRDCLGGVKGWMVLSYNDTPQIHKLYHSYHIRELERSNHLAHKTKNGVKSYKKRLITNFQSMIFLADVYHKTI